MRDLPAGWVDVALSDVAEINPRKPQTDALTAEAPVSFVPMAAVDADRGSITHRQERLFASVRKGYTAFANDDVIVAKITPSFENGKAAVARNLVNGLGFGSSEFHVIRAGDRLLPEYAFHFLRQRRFRDEAAQHMTGTAGQLRVPTDYLRDLRLPLPPIDEQRELVKRLNALNAASQSVRGRLADAQRRISQLRRVVASAAITGALTTAWRDEHANRLDPSLDDLPPGWSIEPLGAVTINHDGKRVPIKASDRAMRRGAYPYYGASGIIDTIDDYLFDGHFLLVAEDGANLLSRSTPIAFQASGQFWVNNHAHVLEPRSGVLLRYLEVHVNATDLQDYVTGSAQPKLTQAALNRIPIALPPEDEQGEIVARYDALIAAATGIEDRLRVAVARADLLPQAIFDAAMEGRLTMNGARLDPDAPDESRNE